MGTAVRATRATLVTLGERLHEEATDVASPLPGETDRHLTKAGSGKRSSYQEFLGSVAERAGVDKRDT